MGSAALAAGATASSPPAAAITFAKMVFIATPPSDVSTRYGWVGDPAISRSTREDRARPFRRGLSAGRSEPAARPRPAGADSRRRDSALPPPDAAPRWRRGGPPLRARRR